MQLKVLLFLQIFVSFLIVALGHPSFIPWLAPFAAAAGFGIFWKSIYTFPFRARRFWIAFIWFSAIQAVQLFWMTSKEFQGNYILFIYAGLCLWLGLQFAALTLFIPQKETLSIPRLLAIAGAWVVIEWSRFFILCGFSFNLSGVALSANQYSLQMASIWGILGLSFWVILTNLFFMKATKLKSYLAWIVLAIIPYAFGFFHIRYHEHQMQQIKTEHSISTLLIQTGLLPSEKTLLINRIKSFISPYDQWSKILRLIKESSEEKVDLIVLPESALPFNHDYQWYSFQKVTSIFREIFDEEIENFFPDLVPPFGERKSGKVTNSFFVQTIANFLKTEVVIGLDHDQEKVFHSSAFHFTPNQSSLNRYDKRVLLPLAECLPFKWLLPFVKAYGITQFFTPGKEAKVFSEILPFSVSICYEEMFPHLIRESRIKGAKLLVNISNDNWYPFSNLPQVHFDHAKLRAIENGAPLIRACNTGITAAVDSLGRVVRKIESCDEKGQPIPGVLRNSLNLYEYPTLFLYWGNWAIVSISLFFLIIFLTLKKYFSW